MTRKDKKRQEKFLRSACAKNFVEKICNKTQGIEESPIYCTKCMVYTVVDG